MLHFLEFPKYALSRWSFAHVGRRGEENAWGEGIAAVVLKTLDAALEDGDDIECIIRETGFAQDGKTQGITS